MYCVVFLSSLSNTKYTYAKNMYIIMLVFNYAYVYSKQDVVSYPCQLSFLGTAAYPKNVNMPLISCPVGRLYLTLSDRLKLNIKLSWWWRRLLIEKVLLVYPKLMARDVTFCPNPCHVLHDKTSNIIWEYLTTWFKLDGTGKNWTF